MILIDVKAKQLLIENEVVEIKFDGDVASIDDVITGLDIQDVFINYNKILISRNSNEI